MNYMYRDELLHLLAGVPREARGLTYLESPYVPQVTKFKPSSPHLVTLSKRKLNVAFALVERLSYLSGVGHYPLVITSYVSNYRNFVTDTFVDRGAYGPRISCQLKRVYELLRDDPMTRQAVINVYNYLQDNRGDVKDVPCTLSLNFHGDAEKLSLVGMMRSNDIWWGWPYDVGAFCFLLEVMAFWLGRDVDTYTHVVTSLHLYERDVESAKDVLNSKAKKSVPLGAWDLTFENTWPALEIFWRCEEAIRVSNGKMQPPELPQSAYLCEVLDILADYWRNRAA